MKNAEANFFVLHLEKILLGVGLLILLGVVFLFVVGSPYQVTMPDHRGIKQEVGPDGVEKLVQGAVDNLQTNLNKDKPDFDIPEIPDYASQLAATLERPVSSVRFAGLNGTGVLVSGGPEGTREDFILPNVPMPVSVIANSDYGLMDFEQVFDPNVLAGLQKLVGNQEPADFRYVSVEAVFDMNKWQSRFEQIPLDQRVPDLLYRNALYITGVYLVREEQDPVSKRWQNKKKMQVLPGQIHFDPNESKRFTQAEGEQSVQLIKTMQEEVARVPFPPIAEGRPWNPPHEEEVELDPAQRRQLNSINRKIASKEKQVARLKKRLGIEDAPQPDRPGAPGGRFDFEGGNPEDFGTIPGRSSSTRPTTRPSTRPGSGSTEGGSPQARLDQLEREIAELKRERRAVKLGVEVSELPEEAAGGGYTLETMTPEQLRSLPPEVRRQLIERGGVAPGGVAVEGDGLPYGQQRVWAHDLSVEPGRTYRYKVIVTVLNPLFQNKQLSKEQRAENENRISLIPKQIEIDAAPWCDPVRVMPKYFFYVIGGNPNNQSAQIEVYTVHNGAMQVETFNIGPGDAIGDQVTRELPGGAVQVIDMRVGAYMVDIVAAPGTGSALQSARMLYLDPLTNLIAERDVSRDKSDPQREALEAQVNEAREVQARVDEER